MDMKVRIELRTYAGNNKSSTDNYFIFFNATATTEIYTQKNVNPQLAMAVLAADVAEVL